MPRTDSPGSMTRIRSRTICRPSFAIATPDRNISTTSTITIKLWHRARLSRYGPTISRWYVS